MGHDVPGSEARPPARAHLARGVAGGRAGGLRDGDDAGTGERDAATGGGGPDTGIDARTGSIDAAQCAGDTECDDGLACTGLETCSGGSCVPGTPVSCNDGLACTVDDCAEPTGTCTNSGTDADSDGYVALGCADGDDCDDDVTAINPGATELCDGVDNDCSGAPDDGAGMDCVLGSGSVVCTTVCATPGSRTCGADCMLTACLGAEVCGNACDDDGDGLIDEDCTVCGNAICEAGETCATCGADCCPGPPAGDAACDYDWFGTSNQGACTTSWDGATDGCDCGCQFEDDDCGASCGAATCDYCWTGTTCDPGWYGSSDGCDCDCYFYDPDCGY